MELTERCLKEMMIARNRLASLKRGNDFKTKINWRTLEVMIDRKKLEKPNPGGNMTNQI